MALDIFKEGIVGIWDFLLKIAIVSVAILSFKLLHPPKAAWFDLCQRLQSPARPSLRHSQQLSNRG